MLRIDQLREPPLVGRFYLVPTVRYPWFGHVDDWPVMGPKHEDAEHLDFPWTHYHVDVRFLTKKQVAFAGFESWYGTIEEIVAASPLQYRSHTDASGKFHECDEHGTIIHPDPIWRRRKCQREDHGYPVKRSNKQTGPAGRLAKPFIGRRCGTDANGMTVCPHKGFVLDSLPRDAHGRVVCPLHGLTIDWATKTVVAPHLDRD